MTQEHPCGALPVSGAHFNVWYCHHHQAYFADLDVVSQTADGELISHMFVSTQFGPFDSSTDVLEWLILQSGVIARMPTALDQMPTRYVLPPPATVPPGSPGGTEASNNPESGREPGSEHLRASVNHPSLWSGGPDA